MMQVLADPVRRDIVAGLRRQPLAAGEIAAQFSVSRPAVSRHLRVLREAGLVQVETVGRRRIYHFEPAPLVELDRWLDQYRPLWDSRLDALETEVYRTRRERAEPGTMTAEQLEQPGKESA